MTKRVCQLGKYTRIQSSLQVGFAWLITRFSNILLEVLEHQSGGQQTWLFWQFLKIYESKLTQGTQLWFGRIVLLKMYGIVQQKLFVEQSIG